MISPLRDRRAGPISSSCSRVIPYNGVPDENERAPSTWYRFFLCALVEYDSRVPTSSGSFSASFASKDLSDTPFESQDDGLSNGVRTRLQEAIPLQRRALGSDSPNSREQTTRAVSRHRLCRAVARESEFRVQGTRGPGPYLAHVPGLSLTTASK